MNTGRGISPQIPRQPRYIVTFTYQADGQEYSGQYGVHYEGAEIGHTFAICYDPDNPQDNSGSEPISGQDTPSNLIRNMALGVLVFFAYLIFRKWSRTW